MTARDYTAKAIAIVNAGSAIKSRVKEANEDLNRAYEVQKNIIQNACLDEFNKIRADRPYDTAIEAQINVTPANKLYWSMPDLHVFKEKHADAIRAVFPEKEDVIAEIQNLVALRAAVKEVEIVKFERKEPSIEENIKARVLKNFDQMMKEKKAQFNWAADIIREMNAELPYEAEKGLLAPVSVRPVYCMNYAGTAWVRIDWYFNGEKMAFNMIMAAVGVVTDEKKK